MFTTGSCVRLKNFYMLPSYQELKDDCGIITNIYYGTERDAYEVEVRDTCNEYRVIGLFTDSDLELADNLKNDELHDIRDLLFNYNISYPIYYHLKINNYLNILRYLNYRHVNG